MLHATTWLLQSILGLAFLIIGALHLLLPAGLPGPLDWMYELSTAAHVLSGVVEILGGLGLLLPGLTRIRPELTPLAAGGLAIVMVFAAAWHVSQGEPSRIASNVVLALLLSAVAYVRWRRHPLPSR
jgi:uncharacterized membrane protein